MNAESNLIKMRELASSVPRGNLDDALQLEAAEKAARKCSISFEPIVHGVAVNKKHLLKTTAEEFGGRVTLSKKW